MPGPQGHIISNPYKNTFSQVGMPPFYRRGSGRCQGCVVLNLAPLDREGGSRGPLITYPRGDPHNLLPLLEKNTGQQIRLLQPRAWGIQGEPGVSFE